jgi:hypothetical protein
MKEADGVVRPADLSTIKPPQPPKAAMAKIEAAACQRSINPAMGDLTAGGLGRIRGDPAQR